MRTNTHNAEETVMKPKAPKKVPQPETAAMLAAWLAVVTAAATAQRQTAPTPIPFAYQGG